MKSSHVCEYTCIIICFIITIHLKVKNTFPLSIFWITTAQKSKFLFVAMFIYKGLLFQESQIICFISSVKPIQSMQVLYGELCDC